MSKGDLVSSRENEGPKCIDLPALANRVGGDERRNGPGSLTVVGGFHEPARYIVERLPICRSPIKDRLEIGLMFFRLRLAAFIWRIPADVGFAAFVLEVDLCLIQGCAEQVIR